MAFEASRGFLDKPFMRPFEKLFDRLHSIMILKPLGDRARLAVPVAPKIRPCSSCSAGCTENQPGRLILKPFRGTNIRVLAPEYLFFKKDKELG